MLYESGLFSEIIGKPKYISKLIKTFKDGKRKEIVSDSSWKYSYGPIIKNSVYIGSHYDANKEIKEWGSSKFDDVNWKNAQISEPPGGVLKKSFFAFPCIAIYFYFIRRN